MEEWPAVCRHVTAVEEEYMSRQHEMDSVTDRTIINADDYDDDDNDDTSESSVSSVDDDIKGVGPTFNESE
jgi:hypothetical protein